MLGSVILMFVIGYGINMDVEDLTFAVLDRDDTTVSRDYVAQSRRLPLLRRAAADHRLRGPRPAHAQGDISVAIEIPPGFAREAARGRPVEIGAWIDGAMPTRAETIRGLRPGHARGVAGSRRRASSHGGRGHRPAASSRCATATTPTSKSLPAMVPAVIPLLLMMIPAMLTALSVVREKELARSSTSTSRR
jgi:ribosome-dependent ATPase